MPSPSLRGSGLKCGICIPNCNANQSLPLYEGVDWNPEVQLSSPPPSKSPSLRGSGLKLQIFRRCCCSSRVSLFTREWIEINSCRLERHKRKWVSLFTREWIEITQILPAQINLGVSLFTREWIEMLKIQFPSLQMILSPSLRGSGLKSLIIC